MIKLWKHPWDWILHFAVNFIVIFFGWCADFLTILIGLYLEYVQKSQVWYIDLSWDEYLKKHAIGDIIANILGIVAASILRKLI